MCAAQAFLSCITSSLLQKSGHKLQVSGHDFDSYPILIKGQEKGGVPNMSSTEAINEEDAERDNATLI